MSVFAPRLSRVAFWSPESREQQVTRPGSNNWRPRPLSLRFEKKKWKTFTAELELRQVDHFQTDKEKRKKIMWLYVLVALSSGVALCDSRQYDVAAYYYPAWHVDATAEQLHGANWTEWEVVKQARPRWSGHVMPKVPQWGYEMDDDPVVFAKKIDAAASNGVDVFLFDWYWYPEAPEPYLTSSLEKGFLKGGEQRQGEVRVDVGQSATSWYYASKACFSRSLKSRFTMEWPNGESFQNATNHIVDTYFSHPSYYQVRGCPYLSFYHLQSLLDSFPKPGPSAKDALDYVVNRTREKGYADCVHFNGIDTFMRTGHDPAAVVKELDLSSLTSYTWFHYGKTFNNFPVTDYTYSLQINKDYWTNANKSYPVFYIPNVSAAWDPSPRACQSDVFDNSGYPFGPTFASTPAEFGQALTDVKAFLDKTCAPDWCMLTINAWNEWSESAYLEPDTVDGFGRLNAIRDILSLNAEI